MTSPETYGPPALLHIFRDRQPGEGELRVRLCEHPGEDFVAVSYDDARCGWIAKVYRCTLGGTVLAEKAWGQTYKRKRDAVAEAKSSGIAIMPGCRI
jgi:hypothetical protein